MVVYYYHYHTLSTKNHLFCLFNNTTFESLGHENCHAYLSAPKPAGNHSVLLEMCLFFFPVDLLRPPYVAPPVSFSPLRGLSYLGAGKFGLGEHHGGGVDRVSQLLFHQLVGLCCLADPGKRKGGKAINMTALTVFSSLCGHH